MEAIDNFIMKKKQFKTFSKSKQLNDAIQDNEISNYLQDFVNKSLEVKYEKEEFKILQKIIQKQDTEINKLNNVIDRMAEVIEECRQNDCIETTEDLDMSEIAGVEKIKEYFMKPEQN